MTVSHNTERAYSLSRWARALGLGVRLDLASTGTVYLTLSRHRSTEEWCVVRIADHEQSARAQADYSMSVDVRIGGPGGADLRAGRLMILSVLDTTPAAAERLLRMRRTRYDK